MNTVWLLWVERGDDNVDWWELRGAFLTWQQAHTERRRLITREDHSGGFGYSPRQVQVTKCTIGELREDWAA